MKTLWKPARLLLTVGAVTSALGAVELLAWHRAIFGGLAMFAALAGLWLTWTTFTSGPPKT